VPFGIDGVQPAECEESTALVRDVAQIETVDAAEAERFGHGQWAVPELRLGSQQLDRDSLLGMTLEREQSLEAGDAAARDQHVQRPAGGRACVHPVTRTVSRRTLSSPIVFIAMPG